MQVTIKYKQERGQCPYGVETITTPLSSEYDNWRVKFECDKDTNKWSLHIERYTPNAKSKSDEENWQCPPNYGRRLISDTPCDKDKYFKWLNEYVDWVEVDGHIFWENTDAKIQEAKSCYMNN